MCRYHVEGTTILSTWDPCGTEQAAACRLDRDSLCFLGLSANKKLDSVDFDIVPLLGIWNEGKQMNRLLCGHDGKAKDSNSVPRIQTKATALLGVPPRRYSAPPTLRGEERVEQIGTAGNENKGEDEKNKRRRGAKRKNGGTK